MKMYQWTLKPYDLMTKYTPQKDWIEGRGALIAVAMYLGGAGAGLYLASLYFGSRSGILVSWLIVVLMSLAFVLHLSQPLRAWRMFRNFRGSWLARGFVFAICFLVFTGLQLILASPIFSILGALAACGILIYSGFALSDCKGVSLWHSSAVPILFAISGLSSGTTFLLLVGARSAHGTVLAIENAVLFLLVSYVAVTAVFLGQAFGSGSAAKESVLKLVRGDSAAVFWLLEVVIGLALPLGLLLVARLSGVLAMPLVVAVTVNIGCLALRYSILKAGFYSPLLPISSDIHR